MVSKANEDYPKPERPVNTTSLSRGISTSMFLRLCSRAPRMVMARRLEWPVCWRCLALITSSIPEFQKREAGGSRERSGTDGDIWERRKNARQFPVLCESHQRN